MLEFRALSICRLSSAPTRWPSGPFQADFVNFDGERLSLTMPAETIQLVVDTTAEITLFACEYEIQAATPTLSSAQARIDNVSLTAQPLTSEMPTGRKALVGPVQSPIFTPPREYYIPRDFKSLLVIALGTGLIISGFWMIFDTHGYFFGAWILVLVGACLWAATILDIAFFPPWRI